MFAGAAARSGDSDYAMEDYENPEDAPWYAYRSKISAVVVESSVDSVGSNAFTAGAYAILLSCAGKTGQ